MLDAIIKFSLRYRMLVVMGALALLIYGGYLTSQLPIDVLPDLDRPRVVILTECPGMAAEEVEKLVSQPIEIAVLGSSGVQDVRSQSVAGLSVVYIEFGWSTEIRAARQTVQERLATVVGTLPEGIVPYLTPTSSIVGQIVIAGIYEQQGPNEGDLAQVGKTDNLAELLPRENGPPDLKVWKPVDRHNPQTWEPVKVDRVEWPKLTADQQARGERQAVVSVAGQTHDVLFPSGDERLRSLRTFADWVVRPRIRKIPGVAEVFIQGGERKQYHVLADPSALLEYGVSLQDLERALKENNVNASGGFAIQGDTEKPIRLIGRLGPAPAAVMEDLRNIPVKTTDHRTILLEQVATVAEGSAVKRGDGAVNGRPGIVLTIAKQPHIDTRAITDEIAKALQETEASVPASVVIRPDLFRIKNFIDLGIYNVGEAMVIGAFLVLVVLFLFLMNVRTTFITLTAIPLSLVITALVFRLVSFLTGTQLSINVMTLGGIAVAMGELVDDAVVDVENIFRRLKENNNSPTPRPHLQVVFEASKEIRSAIVFGTAVVILVFLPLFALSGVEGRLFAPLGVAYITSILASLLVSLTVTPVLSYYLLPQSKATHHEHDSVLVRAMKWGAGYLIRFSMAHPVLLLVVSWAGVGVCVWLVLGLGRDFLPKFDEGSIQVNVGWPSNSSLQASNEAAAVVDKKFRAMQKTEKNPNGEVLYFVRRTGRAELDEHAMPVNASEYILTMNPNSGRHREEVIHDIEEGLKKELPGAAVEVEQPLNHAMSHMLSGVPADIAIKVYGDDLDRLRATGEQIKAAIADVPGIRSLKVDQLGGSDELHIRLRRADLALYGVSRGYVADFVQAALQGEPVSQVLEGERRFDLVLRLEEGHRTDYAQLGQLRIDLPSGKGQIQLADVADIGDDLGPQRRQAGERPPLAGGQL